MKYFFQAQFATPKKINEEIIIKRAIGPSIKNTAPAIKYIKILFILFIIILYLFIFSPLFFNVLPIVIIYLKKNVNYNINFNTKHIYGIIYDIYINIIEC